MLSTVGIRTSITLPTGSPAYKGGFVKDEVYLDLDIAEIDDRLFAVPQ